MQSNSTNEANWLADDDDDDTWLVPVGGGIGITFQLGSSKLFYCATAQMFYNAVKPDIVGNWEAILQFQIILP